MGREHAAGARAAIPTLEAKEKAWELVTTNESLPNSEIHSTLGGLSYIDHAEIMSNFIDKYFKSVTQLWNARTHEIGQSLVTGLFPSSNITQKVVDKADKLLSENKDLPVGARRIIVEQRDSLARALRNQKVDSNS